MLHWRDKRFLWYKKKKNAYNKTAEGHSELKLTENDLKMNIYQSLYFEGLSKLFFVFFLWQNKVNLQTLTYIFKNITAPANIKSAHFGTVLEKSTFCGWQICLFSSLGLRQHLCPPSPRCSNS